MATRGRWSGEAVTPVPLLYAHRGASERFAEHTRAAYLQALEDGADGVEGDVHLTRDGQPVLWHDDTLDRTSDGTGGLARTTLAAMRELDVSSWKDAETPPRFGTQEQQLLTLDELVDLLLAHGRPVGLALEFKHAALQYPGPHRHRLERAALRALLRRGFDPRTCRLGAIRVSFMSFSAASVNHLLATVNGDHVCQLVDEASVHDLRVRGLAGPANRRLVLRYLRRLRSEANVERNRRRLGMVGPGVAYVRRHPRRVERWAAAATLRVWTVDDARFCLALGVGELTTNRPGPLRGALVASGHVPPDGRDHPSDRSVSR